MLAEGFLQGSQGRRLDADGAAPEFGFEPVLERACGGDGSPLHQHLQPFRIAERPHRQGRAQQLKEMQSRTAHQWRGPSWLWLWLVMA